MAVQYPDGSRVIEDPTEGSPWGGTQNSTSTPQYSDIPDPLENRLDIESDKTNNYGLIHIPGFGYIFTGIIVDINIWNYISLDDEESNLTENSADRGTGSQ